MDSFLVDVAMAVMGLMLFVAFGRAVTYVMVRLFRSGGLSPQQHAALLNGLGRVSVSSFAHDEPSPMASSMRGARGRFNLDS